MEKLIKRLTILAFLVVVVTLSAATMFSPKVEFSAAEGRHLEKRPQLSIKSISDSSFMIQIESYIQDHFYKRQGITNRFFKLEKIIGRAEINGTVIGKEEQLLYVPKRGATDGDALKKLVTTNVDYLVGKLDKERIKTKLFLLPSKTYDLPDFYRKTSLDLPYRQAVKSMGDWLSADVAFLDVGEKWAQSLSENEIKELFYKTDHHWNGEGAYMGYKTVIDELLADGLKISPPYLRENLKKVVKNPNSRFEGSHNRVIGYNVKFDKEKAYAYETPSFDLFTTLEYQNHSGVMSSKVKGKELFHRGLDKPAVSYADMTTGDIPYIHFENRHVANKYNILVLKDSYFNGMSSLLPLHFANTYAVDMRHYQDSLLTLIQEKEINLILLMNNSFTISGNALDFKKNE